VERDNQVSALKRDPVRRAVEFVLAALIGVIVSPAAAAISVVILLVMGPPVIFRHRRIGYRGQPFTLYKFRTMSSQTGPDGHLLPDAQRMTPMGEALRRTSLDELPQIWNVLRGDMSLVGPRPLLPAYLPRYDSSQRRRLDVRPGITGWCQVNGRNALDWDAKFALDTWYVENRSLWLDLRILARTVPAVLRRQGISQAGHATMPEFTGNAHER
jgi:lipopolysaccharide/colanic/teichoic acid biosynthesis glycosyltransferase